MIVRRELHFIFVAFALSVLWILSSNEIASTIERYNPSLAPLASSVAWIPVLLIYIYATVAFFRVYKDVDVGITKNLLTYQFLFVLISTVYFFLQRVNEVFFSTVPSDIIQSVQARYGLVNEVLKFSWLAVLLVNLGIVLYTVYLMKNFSIRYGFASKRKQKINKYPFVKMILLSIFIGALYDYSIVFFIKDITILHAILIEQLPLIALGTYAVHNLIKSLKRFTEMTRRVLISSSLYIILLIAHFILRYADAQMLISTEDLRRLIVSYSGERILLSILLYGTLISILVLAIELSRTAIKMGDKYGAR